MTIAQFINVEQKDISINGAKQASKIARKIKGPQIKRVFSTDTGHIFILWNNGKQTEATVDLMWNLATGMRPREV